MMAGTTVSAAEIAAALVIGDGERPATKPDPAQTRVIEYEAPTPVLVKAGAGSGKTETMANRVLWLVANEPTTGVTPAGVLGVTFTNKAAGEFRERLALRLGQLPEELLSAERSVEQPRVSTYNSFANDLFREFAIYVGLDPAGEVLSEAAARALAREVVLDSQVPGIGGLGNPAKAAGLLAGFAAQAGEHLADFAAASAVGARTAETMEAIIAQWAREQALEPSDPLLQLLTSDHPARGRRIEQLGLKIPRGYAQQLRLVAKRLDNIRLLEPLAALAAEFDARKRELGLVQFSDQVRYALQALEVPEAAQLVRERYSAVLLDEYQDTSTMQVRLLSRVFAGGRVMAVGDPNQSIYGFRGAAAGILDRFHDDFATPLPARPDATHELSTSWRNDRAILAAANGLLAAAPEPASMSPLGAREQAGAGEVAIELFPNQSGEMAALADWFATHLEDAPQPPTMAVLLRAHRHTRAVARALAARGLPYVVVGGGGLLHEPPIVDLHATLRVLAHPEDGASLVRIMASARWRLGVADMDALRRFGQATGQEQAAALPRGPVTDESELDSIVDALDRLRHGIPNPERFGFSSAGYERLRLLAAELAQLRAARHLPVAALVRRVATTLELDIELAANERRDPAVLDAYLDEVDGWQRANPRASLEDFLGWLDIAEADDRLAVPAPEPEPGTVQILTMHSAKGLEWDVVGLPCWDAAFPGSIRDGGGWLIPGHLPYPLRGDVSALPEFTPQPDWSLKELASAISGPLKDGEQARHEAEERRVAYVAVTRARHALWISAGARGAAVAAGAPTPSAFLTDIWAALHEDGPETPPLQAPDETSQGIQERVVWPPDPLGSRRPAVELAAAAVAGATGALPAERADALRALLATEQRTEVGPVAAPATLSASALQGWVADAEAMQHARARPMPERPQRQARVGTLAHAMIEGILTTSGAVVLGASASDVDIDLADLEQEVTAEQLSLYRERLAASPFASGEYELVDTELELHVPVGARTLICRIDAVFRHEGRPVVVDWKTGRYHECLDLQLWLYRLAYARYTGVPFAEVAAAFFMLGEEDAAMRLRHPRDISETELLTLLERLDGEPGSGRPEPRGEG